MKVKAFVSKEKGQILIIVDLNFKFEINGGFGVLGNNT
jgi:hypothetical protein